jgi:hypothetical protein
MSGGQKENMLYVRTNLDQTKTMQDNMDFYLDGINGIDEITKRHTTTGYLYIGWVDEYLKWDSPVHVIYVLMKLFPNSFSLVNPFCTVIAGFHILFWEI